MSELIFASGHHLNGMPVVLTVNAGTWDRKELAAKQWHAYGGRYALRVQKKWNKRFPPQFKPGVFMTKDRIFVHPLFWPTLKSQFKSRGVQLE